MVPGAHLRGVHVAAEPVRHQGAAHLPPGRGDAHGAEHRLDGQVDAQVAVLRAKVTVFLARSSS